MHIAVLCSPNSWYLQDLRRAAGARHEITPLLFRDLTSELSPQGPKFHAAGLDLLDVDAVLVRTMPPASLEQVVMRMDVLGQL